MDAKGSLDFKNIVAREMALNYMAAAITAVFKILEDSKGDPEKDGSEEYGLTLQEACLRVMDEDEDAGHFLYLTLHWSNDLTDWADNRTGVRPYPPMPPEGEIAEVTEGEIAEVTEESE